MNDPGAKVFGFYTTDKKAGAAVKTFADGSRTIYIGNYPVTPAQWRELLMLAGEKPVSAPGSYIRRHGDLLLFHTGKKGTHKITLPAGSKGAVELYSGKKFNGGTISFVTDKEADTKVFKTF